MTSLVLRLAAVVYMARDHTIGAQTASEEEVIDYPELKWSEFVEAEGLRTTMSVEELASFKARFLQRVDIEANFKFTTKSDAFSSYSRGTTYSTQLDNWTLNKLLSLEMPVTTEYLVHEINNGNIGWTADLVNKDLTMGAAMELMGYIHDPGFEATSDDVPQNEEWTRRLQDLPLTFDARDKWPHCREVMGHVRDQGRCGSCWAQAAASTLEARLCIATEGRFTGRRAWISAGYMTSCYNMQGINGCIGGNPGWALRSAQQSFFGGGVPTGNEHRGTCVPYFAQGDALQHFDTSGNVQAPQCPKKCTSQDEYPRDLSHDKFYPTGNPLSTRTWSAAKKFIYDGGHTPMAFTAYQDFMAYKTGYYAPTGSKKIGGHSTTALGWTSWNNKDYALSVNSWGRTWGEQGFFKIDVECCGIIYFGEKVLSKQSAMPLPDDGEDFPPAPAPIPTQGFSCNGKCQAHYEKTWSCQCNAICGKYQSCCPDYVDVCVPSTKSCRGTCGTPFDHSAPCQCNERCEKYSNCCHDYWQQCTMKKSAMRRPLLKDLGVTVQEDQENVVEGIHERVKVVMEIEGVGCRDIPFANRLALEAGIGQAVVAELPLNIEVVSAWHMSRNRAEVLPCDDHRSYWAQDALRYVNRTCGFAMSPMSVNVAFYVLFRAPLTSSLINYTLHGDTLGKRVLLETHAAMKLGKQTLLSTQFKLGQICVEEDHLTGGVFQLEVQPLRAYKTEAALYQEANSIREPTRHEHIFGVIRVVLLVGGFLLFVWMCLRDGCRADSKKKRSVRVAAAEPSLQSDEDELESLPSPAASNGSTDIYR